MAKTNPVKNPKERALLVGVKLPGSTMEKEREYLDELAALARSAGAEVAGAVIQQRTRLSGSTYVGAGKLEAIGGEVKEKRVNLVIFDDALSPAQARNIERSLKVNVIDRTELILDIFSKRARTKQAKIQVEIAQLTYALPRLRRLWDHLSRQEGGIGTRGPGEKQLEVDKRRVRERITRLRSELKRITRGTLERRKRRGEFFNATLVGYTNAGKSTLLNSLSGSGVYESGRLFSTLDSTTRRVEMEGGRAVLFTDTVGFIRKLPPHLVASFKSTLIDVERADLLLHVVDASAGDFREEIQVVNGILEGIFKGAGIGGAAGEQGPEGEVETWLVLNKIDRLSEEEVSRFEKDFPEASRISASRGDGMDALRERISAHLEREKVLVRIEVPLSRGKAIASVEEAGEVRERKVEGKNLVITAALNRESLSTLEEKPGLRLVILPDEGGRPAQ